MQGLWPSCLVQVGWFLKILQAAPRFFPSEKYTYIGVYPFVLLSWASFTTNGCVPHSANVSSWPFYPLSLPLVYEIRASSCGQGSQIPKTTRRVSFISPVVFQGPS